MSIKKSYLIFSVMFVLLAISLVSAGYSGTITITKTSGGKIVIGGTGQLPEHYCGNDILETYIGEQCDGVVYTNCSGIDASWTGELSCTNNCLFDTSACSIPTPITPPGGGGGSGGSGGSGGGDSPSGDGNTTDETGCVEDWSCNDWTSCINGLEMRTCTDSNECETEKIKPTDERGCSTLDINTTDDSGTGNTFNTFFSAITGAVIGGGSSGWALIIIVLVIVGIALWFVSSKKGKKKS
jgi:hypothetical protein